METSCKYKAGGIRDGISFVGGRFSLLLIFWVVAVVPIAVSASQTPEVKPTAGNIDDDTSGQFCGLYCLYTVLMMADKEVAFVDLYKPEYTKQNVGSTLSSLSKAAHDHGICALPVRQLTSCVLRACNSPVILHVKKTAGSREYDHYELFLGAEGDSVRLYDPPRPLRLEPFGELAARWDGTGLVLSTNPIDQAKLFAPARRRFLAGGGIALLALVVLHLTRRYCKSVVGELFLGRPILFSLLQATGLVLLALPLGFAFHFISEEGLLAVSGTLNNIRAVHAEQFLERVNAVTTRKIIDEGGVAVDARDTSDYNLGHLPGAISIPVRASRKDRMEVLEGISNETPIVVYCQSATCSYGEEVARLLLQDGYDDISIFGGGWEEWSDAKSE